MDGLINKYKIQKWIPNPNYNPNGQWRHHREEYILQEVDETNEYFVLRLDDNCKDKIHLEACRKAVLIYAEEIKNHLPKLSEDIINRYK